MDDLVQAMGGTGISRSQVSRLCEEIDGRVDAFLSATVSALEKRPLLNGRGSGRQTWPKGD